MEYRTKRRLGRDDWVRAALEILRERGVDDVKIVVIVERMGVTSGGLYWHFKGLRDLLDCLLDYRDRELTDAAMVSVKAFSGPPEDRILNLMMQVVEQDAAIYDHAISIWARENPSAREVYDRTLRKRFDFARWMFKQVGFSDRQATIRGRLLVACMMGESATDLKCDPRWTSEIEAAHKVLLGRCD